MESVKTETVVMKGKKDISKVKYKGKWDTRTGGKTFIERSEGGKNRRTKWWKKDLRKKQLGKEGSDGGEGWKDRKKTVKKEATQIRRQKMEKRREGRTYILKSNNIVFKFSRLHKDPVLKLGFVWTLSSKIEIFKQKKLFKSSQEPWSNASKFTAPG